MFKCNKYTNWYFSIIDNAKQRDDSDITENHHIIPKSLGGDDINKNLVKLTPREHYVCHWLLTKMVDGPMKHKMTFALHTFFHFNKIRQLNFKSRQYEFHKIQYKEACRQRIPHTKGEVFIFKNQKTQEEFEGTISMFAKHSELSPQSINWLVKHCINPDDTKRKIHYWGIWIESLSIFSYDKPRSPYTIQNLPNVVCEYCAKVVSTGNYNRWHGNNCKIIDAKGHYERTRQVAKINQHR